MKHIVAKTLVFLIFACLSIQLAHACYIGATDGHGGYPSCDIVGVGACSAVKRMALQEGTIEPETSKPDHLKEFLAMAESGAFDGKTIYMDASSTIAKGIMNLPLDHWKSFTQKVVMKGWQKDPRLDSRVQRDGTPQVILEVETKTGHKFVIHLVDDAAVKKVLKQQQSNSQQPSIKDKLLENDKVVSVFQ
jgi:hypothetical protein